MQQTSKILKLVSQCNPSVVRFYNTQLSKTHLKIQQECRKFAEIELKPIANHLDRNRAFPTVQIQKLGQMGFMGITASIEYGGTGLDMLGLAIVVEELSKGCGSTGAIVSIHNCLYVDLLNRCGNEEQKCTFLRPFTSGRVGCFALSEPDAGSDVGALSCTAEFRKDHYVLNGIKSWVTSGLEGECAIVFATIDRNLKHKGITAFIVPMDSEGLSRGKNEEKMGIKATSTCTLVLDNVRVPIKNILGCKGGGFRMAMEQLDRARLGIASQALGIGQAAFGLAIEYARKRHAFNRPISEMQAVRLRIAEMAIRLDSAQLLVWRAAESCDRSGHSPTKYCSMAKVAASEAATHVAHGAVQILGGMGYISDMPAERYYRDARITEIYGGVSDIQRLLIADKIFYEYG